jgi:hypothetical protein
MSFFVEQQVQVLDQTISNSFRGKPSSHHMPTIIENEIRYTTSREKAELFSDHLAKVFSENNEPGFDDEFKRLVEAQIEKFDFTAKDPIPFTLQELENAIKSLNNKTTLDPQGICNRLLKNLSAEARTRILTLFNLILSSSKLPNAWKESKIHMIKKKADSHSTLKSFRPISLTSCLCKLNERLIQTRLLDFLNKNNTIKAIQSGFRRHRQTKDNIFFLVQKALETFNRNKNKKHDKWKLVGILFDIASAFDKVWHNGLVFKLINAKIPVYLVAWIKDFIANRSFTVEIEDARSESKNITCGVPQGAVLSPLLFSLFINDIPDNTEKNENYNLLFADDLIHFHIYTDSKEATKIINLQLVEIQEWLDKWRLKMAVHKCSQMIFNNLRSSPSDLDIHMNGIRIARSKTNTFLGVTLDEKLNFEAHIEQVRKKSISRLNIIKTLSHRHWKLSTETLKQLFDSLISSVFEYSAILLPTLSDSLINKLQVIQNSAFRSILHLHFNKATGKNTSIKRLHTIAKAPMVKARLKELTSRYLTCALINKNPIIKRCISEYKAFAGGRTNTHTTLLDDYKNIFD